MGEIADFISREDAAPWAGDLRRIAGALAHREPDNSEIYGARPLGLARMRLSISGLTTGHQAVVMAWEDGLLALVANGEAHNDPEFNEVVRRLILAQEARR